jgi:hypothetical protein
VPYGFAFHARLRRSAIRRLEWPESWLVTNVGRDALRVSRRGRGCRAAFRAGASRAPRSARTRRPVGSKRARTPRYAHGRPGAAGPLASGSSGFGVRGAER